MCKLVCPIFTTPIPDEEDVSLPAVTDGSGVYERRLSVLNDRSPTASIIGLGAATIIDGVDTSAPDPLTRMGVGEAGDIGEEICTIPPSSSVGIF